MSWMRARGETWYPEETWTDGSQLGQRDGVSHVLAVGFWASPFIILNLFLSNKNYLTTPPRIEMSIQCDERNPEMSKLERPLDTNCPVLPKGKLKSREVK